MAGRVRERVVVVGPVTPPVTGMVEVTRAMVGEFERRGTTVTVLDVSRRRRWIHAIRKPGKYLLAAVLVHWFALRGPVTLYMPVNSGWGIWLNVGLLALVRRRCRRLVLHHHTFGYLERRDARIGRLLAIGGSGVLHLLQCDRAGRRLRALYGAGLDCRPVSNAVWVDRAGQASLGRVGGEGALTLGHLSNLSLAKGLPAVLELVRRCRKRGWPVRLLLAGPVADDEAGVLLSRARADDGDWIEHIGPVYGAEKRDFFAAIDLFVLPSRLESEPVVILEALSHGRPVLTRAVGCIPERVDAAAGCLVVPEDGDFVEAALDWLAPVVADPGRLDALSRAARGRLESLGQRAREDLERALDACLDQGRTMAGRL